MTDGISSAANVALALQQRNMPTSDELEALGNNSEKLAPGGKLAYDDAKAIDTANKFEALLIHNMLKTMRKTTMGGEKSNDRAIYDDMLDERLAETMIEAGGIGIADQLLNQIRQQQGINPQTQQQASDTQRLRELFSDMQDSDSGIPLAAPHKVTQLTGSQRESVGIRQIDHLNNLWGDAQLSELSTQQSSFVHPLLPHARRNAQKLGTSPQAILAIAALETGWGRSTIKDRQGNESHNLFGIKATASDEHYATTMTTEYIEGESQKLQAKFKTYASPADAVDGFADFILANPRYSQALQHADNPQRFLEELQIAGYATDPRYAEKAISIMRQIERSTQPL